MTQGDKEKALGITPDPMMDRTKALNLPNDQINFIKYVCMPAYELVASGLPNTEEMLTNVRCVFSRSRYTYRCYSVGLLSD